LDVFEVPLSGTIGAVLASCSDDWFSGPRGSIGNGVWLADITLLTSLSGIASFSFVICYSSSEDGLSSSDPDESSPAVFIVV